MIDFSTLKNLTIPEGSVKEIAIGGVTVWKNEPGVGDSVFMNVDGVRTEFIIVHIGRPSTYYYDSSCDGTWLLMKDCYTQRQWSNVPYGITYTPDAYIFYYLQSTFFNLLDADIRSIVKEVKIPFTADPEYANVGEDGWNRKVFLLSVNEVIDADIGNQNQDGVPLKYFENARGTTKTLAYYNGNPVNWVTRTLDTAVDTDEVFFITSSANGGWGGYFTGSQNNTYGIRPAMILPSPLRVDENNNVIV